MQAQEEGVVLRPQLSAGYAETVGEAFGYGMAPTGEGVAAPLRRAGRAAVGGRQPVPARKRGRQPAPKPSPESRREARRQWERAKEAAAALVAGAAEGGGPACFMAATGFEVAVLGLEALAGDRDDCWALIVNHAIGMVQQILAERRAESLPLAHAQALQEIAARFLGPAERCKDDLVEALRLVEDAGCDPYHGISRDPDPGQEEG